MTGTEYPKWVTSSCGVKRVVRNAVEEDEWVNSGTTTPATASAPHAATLVSRLKARLGATDA